MTGEIASEYDLGFMMGLDELNGPAEGLVTWVGDDSVKQYLTAVTCYGDLGA